MTPKFFGRWGEYRFYTACCVHKMAVSVAGSAAEWSCRVTSIYLIHIQYYENNIEIKDYHCVFLKNYLHYGI